MTNEEAIKVLKDMIPKTCKMVNGRYVGGFEDTECPQFEAVQVAVEALEKQLPKKPELWGDGYDEDGNLIYDNAKCPNCGNDDFEYGINNLGCAYCPDCGQALDWSDTE